MSLSVASQTQIPLANTMPNLNTTYTTPNTITVSQAGTYEINYYLNLSMSVASTLTIAVRQNGTNIPATQMSRSLSANANSIYSGSVIVTLTAGTNIDLAMSALVALNVTLSSGVNATLSVKKLN